MPTFRDFLASDVNHVFFNADENATEAIVDGKNMKVVIDNDSIKEQQSKDGGEGLENEELLFHVQVSDLDENPFIGKHMMFNYEEYQITNLREAEGVYIITLGGVTSWR